MGGTASRGDRHHPVVVMPPSRVSRRWDTRWRLSRRDPCASCSVTPAQVALPLAGWGAVDPEPGCQWLLPCTFAANSPIGLWSLARLVDRDRSLRPALPVEHDGRRAMIRRGLGSSPRETSGLALLAEASVPPGRCVILLRVGFAGARRDGSLGVWPARVLSIRRVLTVGVCVLAGAQGRRACSSCRTRRPSS